MAIKHVSRDSEKMRKIGEKVCALQALGYLREVGDPFSDTEWCMHNNLDKGNTAAKIHMSTMWRHMYRGKDKVLGVGLNASGQPVLAVFAPKDLDGGHCANPRYTASYVCGQSEQTNYVDRPILEFLHAFGAELQAAGVQGVPEIYILCSDPVRYRVKYMNGRAIVVLF